MRNKLRLGGCVVLYNPDSIVIENLNTYKSFLDCVVVVDNSTQETEVQSLCERDPKLVYLSMGGNKGIAAALNVGMDYLCGQGYDFALTMDQDSKFPLEDAPQIIEILNSVQGDYSILGLNFNYHPLEKSAEIVDVPHWITSGNFVNLCDYADVGKFQEDLFIDYVDYEFAEKLKNNHKKIGYLKDYALQHKIGSPIPINIFGRTFYAMNHSAIRYYYRYRNSCFLFLRNHRFYSKLFLKELFVQIPKMMMYEKNRQEKLKMICLGMKDGFKGKLGVYRER